MVEVLTGLSGGFVATVTMTVLMTALGGDEPPPTASLLSEYAGDGEPESFRAAGMVLHVLYGVTVGGVFAVVFAVLGPALPLGIGSFLGGVLWGVVYGLGLYAVALFFWFRVVLPSYIEPDQVLTFLLFHIDYGFVLGAWVGLGVV